MKERIYNNQKIDYLTMLKLTYKIINDLRFEAVTYFEDIISKAIAILDKMLSDSYLVKNT